MWKSITLEQDSGWKDKPGWKDCRVGDGKRAVAKEAVYSLTEDSKAKEP